MKFFDKFGSESHTPFDGGYVEIKCNLDGPCEQGDNAQLLGPNNYKIDGTCFNDSAKFRLNVTKDTAFGEYKCALKGGASATALKFRYRMRKYSEIYYC